ncbi:uncharacterized protein LOC126416553 isoform X2 [Schistocerca serialis cubense]|uniref:uncharacterized protein LOC126416553 isoform X2 n=1 Tax=Schistocerca serialis cubense TaxID=2023355 RepID=UPI00214E501A|nr:uncharacterized protein LOC126416553 isoform X2 [Schistocerca serialis cubense]
MQKALIAVVVIAACVGASSAEVTCSDECLELAKQANSQQDPLTCGPIVAEYRKAGCDDRCLLYQPRSTSTEEGGSDRINARSHSRKLAAHRSRHAPLHHRSNHH